jgi:hypothetical protein
LTYKTRIKIKQKNKNNKSELPATMAGAMAAGR